MTASEPGGKTYKHLDGLKVSAWFSPCHRFRYLLTIDDESDKSGKTVCAVMQNPSVADEFRADKSVQFLEKLIFRKTPHIFKGVKRLYVVNQFAWIQTRGFRGNEQYIGKENDQAIRQAIDDSDLILIAWGKKNPYKTRKAVIHKMLELKKPNVLFRTKAHPSRGSYTDFIIPYGNGDHLTSSESK